MNKFEYMAMSLPFGLKILRPDNKTVHTMVGLDHENIYFKEKNDITFGSVKSNKNKPILRPLSDLRKEITQRGFNDNNPFNLPDWLEDKFYTLDLHKQVMLLVDDTPNWINQLDFMLVNHLIWLHFDIYELIEEGEAVDYHMLPDFVF